MYAQLTHFDGPRTPEQLAAADFGGRERIMPALAKLGEPIRLYQLRRDDGAEIILLIAESREVLVKCQQAVMGTGLLPGEDRALLTGPDRIELYPVTEVHDISAASESTR
jgi:hypothetical protein